MTPEQRMAKKEQEKVCEHEWQTFKQTLRAERTDVQLNKGFEYKGGPAHLVIRACVKCKEKLTLDMKMEK